jgi:hypothetical protein
MPSMAASYSRTTVENRKKHLGHESGGISGISTTNPYASLQDLEANDSHEDKDDDDTEINAKEHGAS